MTWLVALLVAILIAAIGAGIWRMRRLRSALAHQVGVAEREIGVTHAGSLNLRAELAIRGLIARMRTKAGRNDQMHSITGLPTRESLYNQMVKDTSGTLIILACRDYDRLCIFDPAMGERVLMTIVARLRTMVASTRFIAQIDRAHLAVWLGPDVSSASAEAEAQAMSYALSDQLIEGEQQILPGIALRSARFDAAHEMPQTAVSKTLSAFAAPIATQAGRAANEVDLVALTREQFLVEQDLRQAIARDELYMAFQPLIDAEKGRVCGAEALIRWEHGARGNIPPGHFIPFMEAAGITHEISLWALNHALREARGWQTAGYNGLRVAVNLSGRDLEVEALPALIERTLERHGLTPDALEVELTESVALAVGDRAARLCQAMRSMGVAIAIDDFGTGYSNLGALSSLSFDKLKIDRSFVTNVHSRRDSQAICGALLALGRGLGIQVLAEGVESAFEYAWLRAHGCRFFQGYHFARPLSPAAFIAFISDPAPLVRSLSQSPPLPLERHRA